MTDADEQQTAQYDLTRAGLFKTGVAALGAVCIMVASTYWLQQSASDAVLEPQRQSVQQVHRDTPQLSDEYRRD